MCVIFACGKGRPDHDLLERAADQNKDGIGVAWPEGGRARWVKGLELKDAKELIDGLKEPFLIHVRAASIGGPSKYLTHPFPITNTADVALTGVADQVLMQNGTWTDWSKELRWAVAAAKIKMPRYPWSDARALAIMVSVYGPGILDVLNLSDRIAILDPSRKEPIQIWGHWDEKNGFLQSSHVQEKRTYTQPSYNTGRDYGLPLGRGKATNITVNSPRKEDFTDEEFVGFLGELRCANYPYSHRAGTA